MAYVGRARPVPRAGRGARYFAGRSQPEAPPMRTFSEEDARAVFARAAREAPAADDLRGERLTLDELVEIGRASGLDPERVALAATGLGAPAPRATTLLGIPTEVVRTRTVPGPLSDVLWEETVDAARTLFGGPGAAEQVGRVRQWTSRTEAGWGTKTGIKTRVTARPRADGTTGVRIEREGQRANVWGAVGGAAFLGLMSLLPLIPMALGTLGDGVDPLGFALLMLALAAALGAATFVGLRRGAVSHAERFEAALDRIDLVARQNAAAPERLDARDAARLDLNLLDDEPSDARPATRTRTR